MKIRARSIAALAGALSLGAAIVPVGIACAAAPARPEAQRCSAAPGVSMTHSSKGRAPSSGTAAIRTISDGAFCMERAIVHANGSSRVVFTATDLRTGRKCVLTGTA
jgi:hypothetical protein